MTFLPKNTSFTNANKRNMASLSMYIWILKEEDKTPKVKWKHVKQLRTCRSMSTGENEYN